ncbi:hypothetical protein CAPN005_10350 [Capnocytophaga cynodegmi]|nr:hypothetical protein CAPN005_10350 [Capnocytophaga cynodegmi]
MNIQKQMMNYINLNLVIIATRPINYKKYVSDINVANIAKTKFNTLKIRNLTKSLNYEKHQQKSK